MTSVPPPPDFIGRTKTFLEMIKFSHSVFALPFALVAALVAAEGVPRFAVLFWIVVAAVSARTAAMCFNRIADVRFDAKNPRTRTRALVTGELSMRFAWGAMTASVLAFYLAAGMLNFACLMLATPCLAVLLFYSLTKRFTDYSHLFLGAALGLAPIGAWIAVTGGLSWFAVWLAVAVLFWVGGFDILYSCQDYDADRASTGLHSIPKRFGIAGALRIARRFHAVALALFALAWWSGSPPLGPGFAAGVAGVGVLLNHQHGLLRPNDLSRIDAAFFGANGRISLGLLACAAIDVLLLR